MFSIFVTIPARFKTSDERSSVPFRWFRHLQKSSNGPKGEFFQTLYLHCRDRTYDNPWIQRHAAKVKCALVQGQLDVPNGPTSHCVHAAITPSKHMTQVACSSSLPCGSSSQKVRIWKYPSLHPEWNTTAYAGFYMRQSTGRSDHWRTQMSKCDLNFVWRAGANHEAKETLLQ